MPIFLQPTSHALVLMHVMNCERIMMLILSLPHEANWYNQLNKRDFLLRVHEYSHIRKVVTTLESNRLSFLHDHHISLTQHKTLAAMNLHLN